MASFLSEPRPQNRTDEDEKATRAQQQNAKVKQKPNASLNSMHFKNFPWQQTLESFLSKRRLKIK